MSHRIRHLGSFLIVAMALTGCTNETRLVSTLDNGDASHNDVSPQDAADPDTTLPPQDTGPDTTEVDTGPNPPEGPSVAIYCAQAARVMCDRLYECADATVTLRSQLEGNFGFDDQYECRQKMTRRMVEFCHPAAISAQKGRLDYSPQAADTCLDTMQTTSCADFAAGLPPLRFMTLFEPTFCGDIGVATRQPSDACLSHSDCTGEDAYCDGSSYVGNVATNGTCGVRGQAGQSCTLPEDCAEGLYCDRDGVCSEPPGENEPCTSICQSGLICNREVDECRPLGGDSDPCYEAIECQPDLACGADNTCQTPPANGESCFERCQPDLKCNLQTGTCEPLPSQGEDCSGECADGFVCGADSTCQPIASEGDSCASNDCTDGLLCTNATATCVVPALVDTSCEPGNCVWYATCHPSGTCDPLPSLGEACTGACIEPAVCSGGTCTDPSNLEPCDSGSCSAADEFCDDGVCVKG
ncbi:hypothetical protein FIV42_09950 [Persicimonas caeni]|uniref:Dickkopf N-terminal cysteine-rich domain-containing protein n=1 Tax=Persicimonas caeni TaxID=2292766 RepID=A0A4Y6PS44_PERCE|nr:hypothetical protein [Persicimonas caeni]QDG51043.1 hypothetical protein FIV42_09950 [Persicimonas caeni]QED32264.1 hypothetical protein FRD00_09945 [Persicimonas caeni]